MVIVKHIFFYFTLRINLGAVILSACSLEILLSKSLAIGRRKFLEDFGEFFNRGILSAFLDREVAGGVRDYFGDSEAAESWVGLES